MHAGHHAHLGTHTPRVAPTLTLEHHVHAPHHAPSRAMHHTMRRHALCTTQCAVMRCAPHNAPSRAMHLTPRHHAPCITQRAITRHTPHARAITRHTPPNAPSRAMHRPRLTHGSNTHPTPAEQAHRRHDSGIGSLVQHIPKQGTTVQAQIRSLSAVQLQPRLRRDQSPKRRKLTQRQATQHPQTKQGGYHQLRH